MIELLHDTPDEVTAFYYVKVSLWLVGTVLLLIYMNIKRVDTWGQRLRFLTFLYFGMFGTWRSVSQAQNHEAISVHLVAGAAGAFLLTVTMIVSLREDRGHSSATNTTHDR